MLLNGRDGILETPNWETSGAWLNSARAIYLVMQAAGLPMVSISPRDILAVPPGANLLRKFDKADGSIVLMAVDHADEDYIPPADEIRLLREALKRYGDRVAMANSARPDLQQVIDRALAL